MPTSSRTTSSSVTPRLRGNNAPCYCSKSQREHDLLQVGAESAADRLREGGGPEAGSRGGGQADRARQGGQISHGTQYAILFSSAHNLTPGLLRDSRQRLLPAVRPVHRGDDQQEQVDCQGPVPAVVAGQGKPGRQPTPDTQIKLAAVDRVFRLHAEPPVRGERVPALSADLETEAARHT